MKAILPFLVFLATSLLLGASNSPAANSISAPDVKSLTPAMPKKNQKITTFLWFDRNAEEAIQFYSSIFKNSKILGESRWGEGGPVPKGTLMTARFQLEGQEFMALNAGPQFKFTEAISLLVDCETQQEVDELWTKLTAGGAPSQCGWLKDKFGLSWQIVPTVLVEMMQDKDPAKVKRVGEAVQQMTKLDIQKLRQAYDGR